MQRSVRKALTVHAAHPFFAEGFRIANVVVGGLLVAFGLEAFLIPNGFLDGGVTGIAIILGSFVDLPIGVFIGVLNLPFVLLVWWKVGHRSAIRTAIGIATLSVAAFVIGAESAMASAALFFLAVSPMIKRVVDGNAEMKTARVMTNLPLEVASAIAPTIKRRISADKRTVFTEGEGFSNEMTELWFTVARLEEAEVTELVLKTDPDATVIFNDVTSLHGGIYEDRASAH